MDNLIYTMNEYALKFSQFLGLLGDETPEIGDGWKKFAEVMKSLLPILWIASALVSTIWLLFRLIKQTHKAGEADGQADYEKAKTARKRALIAWVFGLAWPVILFVVWPLVPVIGEAIFPNSGISKNWPPLF